MTFAAYTFLPVSILHFVIPFQTSDTVDSMDDHSEFSFDQFSGIQYSSNTVFDFSVATVLNLLVHNLLIVCFTKSFHCSFDGISVCNSLRFGNWYMSRIFFTLQCKS